MTARSLVPFFVLNLLAFALCASYPGDKAVLALFLLVGSGALWIALAVRSSVFVLCLALFLTLGFFCKLVVHFGFGVALIEATGGFDGSGRQWDNALSSAVAGLAGFAAASLLTLRMNCFSTATGEEPLSQVSAPILRALSLALLLVAAFIYALNLRWNILRIGYPIGIDLPFPLYPILSFVIAWGAALGILTLAWWRLRAGTISSGSFILSVAVVGFGASLTMGSRVQFLLYILAAVLALAGIPGKPLRRVFLDRSVIVALVTSAGLFAASLAAVSLQRSYAFNAAPETAAELVVPASRDELATLRETEGRGREQEPAPFGNTATGGTVAGEGEAAAASREANELSLSSGESDGRSPEADTRDASVTGGSIEVAGTGAEAQAEANANANANAATGPSGLDEAPKATVSTIPFTSRLSWIVAEIRSLVVMRWVGLEGVMTTTGSAGQLGSELLFEALAEDPAAGTGGIYQRMSGDPYAGVTAFTFLTLPGPIGVASYSGSLVVIGGFIFALTLLGHLIEWFTAASTRSPGATAIAGVSLAYLVVQMCFPWTLLIYAMELLGAVCVLGLLRLMLIRFVEKRASTAGSGAPEERVRLPVSIAGKPAR